LKLVCQKELFKRKGLPDSITLTIFESHGLYKTALEVSHHAYETQADERLASKWAINPPPKMGEPLRFERDGPEG
jgi:hypothetical protein